MPAPRTATRKPRKRPARPTCTATSRGGKCLVYEKVHHNQKAAIGHIKNIRKRGGKVEIKSKSIYGGIRLQYAFPAKRKKP